MIARRICLIALGLGAAQKVAVDQFMATGIWAEFVNKTWLYFACALLGGCLIDVLGERSTIRDWFKNLIGFPFFDILYVGAVGDESRGWKQVVRVRAKQRMSGVEIVSGVDSLIGLKKPHRFALPTIRIDVAKDEIVTIPISHAQHELEPHGTATWADGSSWVGGTDSLVRVQIRKSFLTQAISMRFRLPQQRDDRGLEALIYGTVSSNKDYFRPEPIG